MRSLHRTSLLTLAALLGGCADTFTPASVVEDLRVLAMVAEPPELRLSGAAGTNTVVLHAIAVAPPAAPAGPPRAPAPADVTWSFCPYSVGAATGYTCAIPACESALVPAADGSVTVDPVAEVMKPACLAALQASGFGGFPSSGSLETLVRYVATLDGLQREAVQRIPVWFGTPPAIEPNLNPVIVAGSFTAGPSCSSPSPTTCPVDAVSLSLAIDAGSFQPYPAGVDRIVTETVIVSFFTTAGRFTDQRAQATVEATMVGTTLELGGATGAWVWAVARDLRGGEAVAGPLRVDFSAP